MFLNKGDKYKSPRKMPMIISKSNYTFWLMANLKPLMDQDMSNTVHIKTLDIFSAVLELYPSRFKQLNFRNQEKI